MKRLNDSYVEGVIKKAANGKMTTGQAAARLGCTKQYVNKLKRKYEAEGKMAFSHGNSGKPKKWRTPPETERRIVERVVDVIAVEDSEDAYANLLRRR